MNPIPFWDEHGLTALVRTVLTAAPTDPQVQPSPKR